MFGNNVRETTATTGAGQITLAGAASGYVSFADQFADGDVVDFIIQDGDDFEFARGPFTAPDRLDRAVIFEKQAGGVVTRLPATGLNLSGAAQVFVGPTAYRSHGGYFGPPIVNFYRFGHNIHALDRTHIPGGALSAVANQLATGTYYFATPTRIAEMGVRIEVAAPGGAMWFGVYRLNDAALDRTATLMLDSTAQPTDNTGVQMVSVPDQLLYGWYLVAALFDNTVARIFGAEARTHFSLFGGAHWDNRRALGLGYRDVFGGLPASLDLNAANVRVSSAIPGLMFR